MQADKSLPERKACLFCEKTFKDPEGLTYPEHVAKYPYVTEAEYLGKIIVSNNWDKNILDLPNADPIV